MCALPIPPCEMTVNLSAIASNFNILQKRVGKNCHVAGVVKSDAYGLGVSKVVAALENQGCQFYYVARAQEAFELRKITNRPIGLLAGPYTDIDYDLVRANIYPVLNSPLDIEKFKSLASKIEIEIPVILHCDTGMNRLGLSAAEVQSIIDKPDALTGLSLKILMSHFACSDEKGHPKNTIQYQMFDHIADEFPAIHKSLCNSSAIFRSDKYHYDQARAGMALYGLNPTPEEENPMHNAVEVHARILQIRQALKGETTGYSASHSFDKNAKIATLGIGYANGLHRILSNTGHVYYKGIACNILGRVSMDLITIDISHIDQPIQTGDQVEIIGNNQPADIMAGEGQTIGYEILTSFGPQIGRRYITRRPSTNIADIPLSAIS